MADQKTKPTEQSVDDFLAKVADEKRRQDCYIILDVMKKATKQEPKMWGGSIIGFGQYHYKYDSGHEGDSCLVGFSPRKAEITVYIMSGFPEREELLAKLGKVKTGKACIYVKKVDDIHLPTLRELVKKSVAYLKKKY